MMHVKRDNWIRIIENIGGIEKCYLVGEIELF